VLLGYLINTFSAWLECSRFKWFLLSIVV